MDHLFASGIEPSQCKRQSYHRAKSVCSQSLGWTKALVFSSDSEKYIGDICNIQYSCLKHIQSFCRNFAVGAPETWRRKPWVSHPLQKQVQTWTRFAAAVRSCTAPAWKKRWPTDPPHLFFLNPSFRQLFHPTEAAVNPHLHRCEQRRGWLCSEGVSTGTSKLWP